MGSLHHLKRHEIVDNTDFDQTDVLCFTSTAQNSFTSKRAPFMGNKTGFDILII